MPEALMFHWVLQAHISLSAKSRAQSSKTDIFLCPVIYSQVHKFLSKIIVCAVSSGCLFSKDPHLHIKDPNMTDPKKKLMK